MDHIWSSRTHMHENRDTSKRTEPQVIRETKDTSRHYKINANPSVHAIKGHLNASDDYVTKWLAQTDIEEKVSEQYIDCPKRPRSPIFNSNFEYHESSVHTFGKSKRRHNSSSDSSLLQQPATSENLPLNFQYSKTARELQDRDPHSQKKQRISPSHDAKSASNSPLIVPYETYQKKARHKTREDRYNPKKDVKQLKMRQEKRSTTKKEKKGGCRKAARNSGEELMQHFSSKNIGQDRLTIRPSSGPGLFKNGRASSPAKRRGVPNLAFSEMEFLQHPRHHPQQAKEDKVSSKSREKEKRKAAQRHDEISTFFKPDRIPLQEKNANQQAEGVQSNMRETFFFTKEDNSGSGADLNFLKFSSPDELYPLNKERMPFSTRKTLSKGHSPLEGHVRDGYGFVNQVSRKASSYVSWPESQFSPAGKSKLVDRQQNSSTPASIRKSIQETRIFQNTGIGAKLDLGHLDAATSKLTPKFQEPPASGQAIRNGLNLKIKSSLPSRSETSASNLARTQSESQFGHRENVEGGSPSETTESRSSSCEIESPDQNHDEAHGKIALQHLEPKSVLYERSVSAPKASFKMYKTSGIPINRKEIGRCARIQRPTTTLPILQATPWDQKQPKETRNTPILHAVAMVNPDVRPTRFEDLTNHSRYQQPLLNGQDKIPSRNSNKFNQQDKKPPTQEVTSEPCTKLVWQNDETKLPPVWKSIGSNMDDNLQDLTINSRFQARYSPSYYNLLAPSHRAAAFGSKSLPLATIPEDEPFFLNHGQVSHDNHGYLFSENNCRSNDVVTSRSLEGVVLVPDLDNPYTEDPFLQLNNEGLADETVMGLIEYIGADDLGSDYDDEINISHLILAPNELEYDLLDGQQVSYELDPEMDNTYQKVDVFNDFGPQDQGPIPQQHHVEEQSQMETFWRHNQWY